MNRSENEKDKSLPFPLFFKESALAHRYCVGKGLEIGGSAHNPFGLNTLNVDITDSMDTEFKTEEIKLCGKALKVDIVAPGDDIPLQNESFDFIVSSHVLEHFCNPIKALIEWDRLIKPSGIIFMIVPHKKRTFDKHKTRTTLQHVVDDYYNNTTEPSSDPHGHQHYWITKDVVDIINWMIANVNMNWKILKIQNRDDKVGNGFTIVIRKKDVLKKKVSIIEFIDRLFKDIKNKVISVSLYRLKTVLTGRAGCAIFSPGDHTLSGWARLAGLSPRK